MRIVAWIWVAVLFLFSGLCFVAAFQMAKVVGSPEAQQLERTAIGLARWAPYQAAEALRSLRSQAALGDLALWLGLGSSGLGILCFVIVAATRRAPSEDDVEDDEDDEQMARIRRL